MESIDRVGTIGLTLFCISISIMLAVFYCTSIHDYPLILILCAIVWFGGTTVSVNLLMKWLSEREEKKGHQLEDTNTGRDK